MKGMVTKEGKPAICPVFTSSQFGNQCIADCAMLGEVTTVNPENEYRYVCMYAAASLNSQTVTAPIVKPMFMAKEKR